jgi:hypothetical protein
MEYNEPIFYIISILIIPRATPKKRDEEIISMCNEVQSEKSKKRMKMIVHTKIIMCCCGKRRLASE